MKLKKATKTDHLRSEITNHPPKIGDDGYYSHVAREFGTTAEYVRKLCKQLGVSNIRANAQSKRINGSSDSAVLSSCARILVLDIETSPHMAYVWKCYKENISPNQMVQHSIMLSWAAKWLGDDMIMVDSMQDEENDKRIAQTIWELVDRADIVIAHNGRGFDEQVLATRWMYHGMFPPSPYKSIDTLQIARAVFRFPTNSLESIARYLQIGSKQEHEGFNLWVKCLANDADAWERMRNYNMCDVELLEKVYLKLRSWDKRHPNVALFSNDGLRRCVCCGDINMVAIDSVAATAVSTYQAYRCNKCGKVMRGCTRDKRDEVMRNVL